MDIVTTTQGGILTLRLCRPAKKNALTRAMYTVLADALDAAGADDAVKVAVIVGEGSDFCAGNDILDFAQGMADLQTTDTTSQDWEAAPVFRFLKALTYFPKPLIAGVQGQAVGVGVTLLLHCDLVVAAEDVRLRLPFLQLGLVPEAGSTLLLPQRIGHARAFEWLTQGQPVTAGQAHAWGLVNRVVPVQEVDATVEALAQGLLKLSPQAVRHTRAFLRNPDQVWQVIRAEGQVFQQLLTSPEAMAAFQAFLSRS
ncbi:enoyl-CoA hydratase/isomerase family protein [Asticcacaulis biprosthecium C19]|uniref:Enoyl-CoA hydratase/isomerase family protein n=1 Tax=Asticcacaulis biprosthecium C19 TaxID=715226 RepID=F4QPQ0_9CAUL|nr:enoyl-CoA hydratase-related protein [Asticcacaulis biprosthecium]EGF90187.1 enoyl-CoA hydratase/isomerase family protein [Asticcacaulis biprosthecium C19]